MKKNVESKIDKKKLIRITNTNKFFSISRYVNINPLNNLIMVLRLLKIELNLSPLSILESW